MTAIAGIAAPGACDAVEKMVDRIAHRGPAGRLVRSTGGVTLGVCWPAGQQDAGSVLLEEDRAEDRISDSQYAFARPDMRGSLVLERDPLGAAPLYYCWDQQGRLCFASEAKGLLGLADEICELGPGSRLEDGQEQAWFTLRQPEMASGTSEELAVELRRALEGAVERLAGRGVPAGSWLSGGLDSSVLAALARPHVEQLHTFAAGFAGAPDLEAARLVAAYIGSIHHEITPVFDEVVAAIPEVVYHLESFDALLVRSSLMNFLAGRRAAEIVPAALTGEGADELFGGYTYLKELPLEELPAELLDLTGRLHNTALQRVDRCAAAHGLVPYAAFLDQEVVELALAIPARYKIVSGMEKWILRRAAVDLLPEEILLRPKAKFWEGAGVSERLQSYAEEHVSDAEFLRERLLADGSTLNSKEEMLYFRAFREHFGADAAPAWVGRTKGAPVT